jgi:hypothetical protein
MVANPEAIKILRVLSAKSREKVPEIIIAVKITSTRSNLCVDNLGKNRMIVNKQTKRIMLFLVNCFCSIIFSLDSPALSEASSKSGQVGKVAKIKVRGLFFWCLFLTACEKQQKENAQ